MTENIKDIHNEIKQKIHTMKNYHMQDPRYLVLNMDLWGEIQALTDESILPIQIPKSDGFWYLYGLKVAVLDGSNLQARHLEVI